MIDHSTMKLGRGAVKKDHRTLRLGNYLTEHLPAPPNTLDWTKGTDQWGMMLNDVHGDCTIAAAAHAVQVWSTHTGTETTVHDAIVLHYYEKWDGYQPGRPRTDGGGSELEVLNQWRKAGFDRHKLFAFTGVDYTDMRQVRQAIHLFGGIYVGLNLPASAQKQEVWDAVPSHNPHGKGGSWGGHAVFVPKYDERGFTCITWGKTKRMTIDFWREYADEAYALLSHDWLTEKGSPAGFDLELLKADLEKLKTKSSSTGQPG